MLHEEQYLNFSSSLHHRAGHRPVVGQFELTYACGLKCVHCYTDCFNTPEWRRQELNTEEAVAIIDKIADGGCFWLCLTGGDPFAHRGFKEVYARAKQRGMLVTIFTTGTSMTEEMADFLAASPPFVIETTIHGTTTEVYEAVTQRPGSFARFLNGLQLIKERNLPLKLKTVALEHNKSQLADVKAFVESWGLEFQLTTTVFSRLDGDTTPGLYQLSPEEKIALTQRLAQASGEIEDNCQSCASSQTDLDVFLQPTDPTSRLFRCGIGYDAFWVDPYGKMILCSTMREPWYDLLHGTLAEGFAVLNRGLRERTFVGDSECTTCTLWNHCMKCPGKALLETGNPEGDIANYCETTHRQAELMGIRHPDGASWMTVFEEKQARRRQRSVAQGEQPLLHPFAPTKPARGPVIAARHFAPAPCAKTAP